MNIDKTVALLLEAKKAYYTTDKPVMSDPEFDGLEEALRKVAPEHLYFQMVGWTENLYRKAIKHSVKMRSMNKSHTTDDIDLWIKNTFKGKFPPMVVEPKIDGNSVTIKYESGRMQYASTRGDGFEGKDCTNRIRFVPGIPLTLKERVTIEIRGEGFLPKDNKFSGPDDALRNVASGLINGKSNPEECKHLAFVAYEILGETFKTVEDKIDRLNELGFDTFELMFCSSVAELTSVYEQYIESYRDEWKFESDGLILQPNSIAIQDEIEDGNEKFPRWAMAWKPPTEEIQTELLGLEVRVTRFGRITVKAKVKPVYIMGAEVKQATLHNWKFVRKLQLNRGDKVLLKRSGDIIPQVIRNMNKSPTPSLLVPDKCPCCGTKLIETDIDLFCPNQDCDDRRIDKIKYWIEKCSMDQVAGSTVRLLYESNRVKNIADLYKLREKDLVDIKGLGDSKIGNLISQIKKSATMSSVEFISRLGIPSIGGSGKALKKLGIKSLDDFRKFSDPRLKTGQNIIAWKKERDNVLFMDELEHCIKITAVVTKTGKPICFTGAGSMSRKEFEALAEQHGYVAHSSVSKELALLVSDDVDGNSAKLVKARKLGIEIMSYTDFEKSIGVAK